MAITYDDLQAVDAVKIHTFSMKRKTSAAVYTTVAVASTAFDYFANDFAVGACFLVGGVSLLTQTFWHNIIFNVGTALAATSVSYVWEYSTGNDVWTALPNVIDMTNCFQNTGVNGVYFEAPLDRYDGLVDSVRFMWVRVRITAVDTPTEGGANATDKVKINNGVLYNTNTTASGMSTLYTAELAGTNQLMNPRSAAANLSLYEQPRPGEWGSTKLSLIITGYSAAGDITLTGTDAQGGAISEVVSVSGNGTLTTVYSYKTVDSSGVDCTGTYTLEITQPRWGIVSKHSPVAYSFRQVIFCNGDGTNNSPFSDSQKSIVFYDSGILNNNVSVLTLGSLLSGALGYACNITFDTTYSNQYRFDYHYIGQPTSYSYFYNTSFLFIGTSGRLYPYLGEVNGCKITNPYYLFIASASLSVTNTAINYSSGTGVYNTANGITLADLTINNAYYGLLTSGGGGAGSENHDSANIVKALRLNAINSRMYDLSLYANGRGCILIDPVVTPVSSRLGAYWTSGALYRIFLDYTVNLKIIDKDNNAISGATVTLKKGNGTQIFSVTTAADGTITQQQVTSKYWEHTWTGSSVYSSFSDSDITDNNPFTMTISKSGFKIYTIKFTFDAKLNWKIMLAKVMDNNFSKRVRINTK